MNEINDNVWTLDELCGRDCVWEPNQESKGEMNQQHYDTMNDQDSKSIVEPLSSAGMDEQIDMRYVLIHECVVPVQEA